MKNVHPRSVWPRWSQRALERCGPTPEKSRSGSSNAGETMLEKDAVFPSQHRREATQEDAQLPALTLPSLGNCISCRQRIRLIGGATTCPTCAVWRRWFVAHRIAKRHLREVSK